MRQWHLDLIALGGLTVLAGTALPELPARVKWPLGVGAWTNAMSFGVLVAAPDAKDHPVYRAGVVGSFVDYEHRLRRHGSGGIRALAGRALAERSLEARAEALVGLSCEVPR